MATGDSSGSVTVFPSAHISPDHINRIRNRIDEGNYDVVAIELDPNRFDRAVEGRPPSPQDILESVQGPQAVVYAVMASIQQLNAMRVGIEPGMNDMRAGIEAAAENDTQVALVDRDINETISRFMEQMDISTIIDQLFSIDPELSKDLREINVMDFDEITSEESAERFVDVMRRAFPEFTEVFIDERDQYMAERLDSLRRDGNDVFAVVGAGHSPGLQKRLEKLGNQQDGADVDVVLKTVRAVDNEQ